MEMAINSHAKEDPLLNYIHEYTDRFSEQLSTRFPKSQPYDMKIVLKDTFIPRIAKTFLLTEHEDQELKKFLNENLAKGYIQPSNSEQASAFFFIKKKDVKL